MKRIKVSRHGAPRNKAQAIIPDLVIMVAFSVGTAVFLWNTDIGKFMPSDKGEDVAIQEQVSSISSSIDSYVKESSDDVKSDAVISSERDKQSFDNMRRQGQQEPPKYVRVLLSPTVGDKKIEEFEIPQNDTYNIRGTAEHYTIEVYSTGHSSYNDFDERLIYDSEKGFVNK